MVSPDAKAIRQAFNRWFLRYADPDHKFTHMPRWLKSDLWDAYQAGRADLITAQAERIAEMERENAELKTRDDPAFTYPFVLRARAAEAEVTRLREALASLYEWYDRDGSVGGASDAFEENRAAALRAKEP